MHILFRWASASVFVLWRAAGSMTAASASLTNPAVLNVSTASPRLTMNASVVTSSLEPHDLAEDKIDNDLKSAEERVLCSLSFLFDASRKLRTETWIRHQIHPAEAFERLTEHAGRASDIDTEELIRWLKYVVAHRARGNTFSDNDAYELVASARNRWNMVLIFHSLRDLPDMKTFADALQRALALKFLDTLLWLMFPTWLAAKLSPEEVYHMMPISAEAKLTDGTGDWGKSIAVSQKLKQLLYYVDRFTAGGNPYDDSAVFDLLVNNRGKGELARFFHSLRKVSGMHDRADAFQAALAAKTPETIPKLMFPLWLSAGMTPEEVFHLMPIAGSPKLNRGVGLEAKPSANPQDLKQLLQYVDEYRAEGYSCSDEDVVKMLAREIPDEDLTALLSSLRDVSGMTTRVDALQKALAAINP